MEKTKITENQRKILSLIRSHDGISRTEIAKKLGLSLPSISKHIERFIQAGHVFEDGFSLSSGGRRPVVLRYNYDYSKCLNVIVEHRLMSVFLTNLNDEILDQLQTHLEESSSRCFMNQLNTIIELDRFHGFDTLVISLPGIIDGTTVVKSNLYPDLEGKDLYDVLNISDRVSLVVCNDVDCKVYGKYILSEEPLDSIYYISYETMGIGSGMIINGHLHRGFHYYAGELGYLENDTYQKFHDVLFNKKDLDFELTVETLSTMVMSVMFVLDPQVIYLAGNNSNMRLGLYEAVISKIKEKNDLQFNVMYCDKNHEIQLKGMLEYAMHEIEMKL